MQRRHVLGAATAAAASMALPAARAQKFPSKPITLIVPFAPGGNLDVVARHVAPALGRALEQNVLVENRAGAGGALGAVYVSRAPADGHTLLVSTPNALVVLPLITKTGYELASFSPIGLMATTPLLIVVGGKSRFKDVAALLAEARAKPGQITCGHSGPGTTNHIALLQLEQEAGVSLNALPYKGSAPGLTDLIGGQIDMMVDQLTSSAGFIQAGSLRALAVMSRERDPGLPTIPTLREAGLPRFDATTATGLLAPAGTPPATIDMLNAALRKALDDDTVKRQLLSVGSPARSTSSQEWLEMLKQGDADAQKLVKAGKLKAES